MHGESISLAFLSRYDMIGLNGTGRYMVSNISRLKVLGSGEMSHISSDDRDDHSLSEMFLGHQSDTSNMDIVLLLFYGIVRPEAIKRHSLISNAGAASQPQLGHRRT